MNRLLIDVLGVCVPLLRTLLPCTVLLCTAAVAGGLPAAAESRRESGCSAVPAATHTKAALLFNGAQVDDVTWKATYTVTVPTSWSCSTQLLGSVTDESFRQALDGLFPGGRYLAMVGDTSVTWEQSGATVTVTQAGTLDGWEPDLWPNWQADLHSGDGLWSIQWEPFTDSAGHIDDVDVTADGLTLSNPRPRPTEATPGHVAWRGVRADGAADLAFTLKPPFWRGMQEFFETGYGAGQNLPYDVERLIAAVALAVSLRRERPDGQVQPDSESRWGLRFGALTLALLAGAAILADALSQVPGLTFGIYHLHDMARDWIVIVLAVFLIRFPRRWWTRVMAGAIAAVLVAAQATVMLAASAVHVAAIVMTGVIAAFLRVALFGRRRPHRRHLRGAGNLVLKGSLIALVLADMGLAIVGGRSSVDGAALLADLLPAVILIGVVVQVARRHRRPPLVLDERDRRLIALAVAVLALVSLPSRYLGLSVNVMAPVLAIGVYLSLRAPGAVLRKGVLGDCVDADGGTMLRAQARLFEAEEDLGRVDKDLAGLDGKAYDVGHDDLRARLERRATELTAWPADETPAQTSAEPAPSLRGRMRAALALARRRREPGEPDPAPVVTRALPPGVRPIDVALALGPGGEPGRNALTVVKFGALPALIVALVQWGQDDLGDNFSPDRWESLTAVSHLAVVLVFWMTPLLILGVAWGSLPGRRGTGRAAVAWLPFAVTFGIAWLIPKAFDLAPAGRWLFFASMLLFTLLVAALATDLTAMGRRRARESPIGLLSRYVGFRKVVATLAVVLPLLATGLTIWTQLQNGVLKQSTPAPQVTRSVPDSSPSGSPSAPPASRG